MKIVSSNSRGMQKSSAVHGLLSLQEHTRPDVLSLSETHLSKAKAGKLKNMLKFDEVLVSESDGRSGGLPLFYHRDLNITSSEVNANFIDIFIDEDSDSGWRFTGFYGEPCGERKHLSWDYIRGLRSKFDLPWMIAGDFNEILYGYDKEGGNIRS